MPLEDRIEAVRRFNRFYTQKVGALREGLLDSPYPLTEARVLYELAHRDEPPASEVSAALGLDAGYLSRILGKFSSRRLIRKSVSGTDRRQSLLGLTSKGREAAAKLNAASEREIGRLLREFAEPEQERLVEAMGTIQAILGGARSGAGSYIIRGHIREHRPGDMGWIIRRHAEIYAQEYRWDEQFEAMVGEIAVRFIRNYDPKTEHCWIAEANGENVGSVMLVKKSAAVAQLRLLLVEPRARGMGIGAGLVEECIRFARGAGYRKMMLWTNSVLHAARHIYEKAGFRLVKEEPHHSFGKDLVGQTWEVSLNPVTRA